MIEKVSAMEQLEEILSVEGVDIVQFGYGDYSINLGRPGQLSPDEIHRLERDVIELALKKVISASGSNWVYSISGASRMGRECENYSQ